jgi:hypothetical protein
MNAHICHSERSEESRSFLESKQGSLAMLGMTNQK